MDTFVAMGDGSVTLDRFVGAGSFGESIFVAQDCIILFLNILRTQRQDAISAVVDI